ncbi:MAG TPA: hypothetical protein VN088_13820, partial [Nocardioides sp.]|nr:hypothetical protein [Nocardioides sp.]
MALATMAAHLRDRAKTTPTLRVAAGASVNSGTTDLTITIPNTAQAGDWAVFFVTGATGGTCSTPSGLIAEHTSQIADTANQPYIHVFSRRLVGSDVSSDLGVSFTFTTGSSDGLCGGVMVFANAAGFAVRPTSTFEPQAETVASVAPQVPSIITGPNQLYAGSAASLSYLSSGLAAASFTTPPSGCTTQINVQATRSAGTGGTCRGFGAWTGPTHAAATESCAFSAAQQWASTLCFSVAPQSAHLVDTHAGPAALAGVPVYNYSNSSGSCVTFSSSNFNRGAITYRPWPERIQQAFGPVVNSRNMAMGGSRAADICTAAFGTATYTSTRSGANNSAGYTNQYVTQPVTKTGLANHKTALYTTDLVGNDFLALGTTTPLNGTGWSDKAITGARVAMYALYRLLRSDNVYGIGQGGQTSTGTWSAVTSDGCIGGGATKTTTPGDKISIPVTGPGTFDLVLLATDDVAIGSGYAGAPYVVKVDGATVTPTVAPGTTAGVSANQMLASGVYNNYKFCQMVASVTVTSGAHTITIEHAGTAGQTLQYQGYMTPLATSPWIIAKLCWPIADGTQTINSGANQYVTWAGYSSAAVGKAALSAFNQAVIDVVAAASGGDGRIIIHDPEASGLFTRNSASSLDKYVNDGDGIHPSEVAHALFAKECLRLLTERQASSFAQAANPTQLAPTTAPATFTMVGTRDFTVPAGGMTAALECEGGGGAGGGGATGVQGRGGGGGAYAKKNSFTYTAGSVLRIVVGPGAAAPAAGVAGGTGTPSQVIYLSGPDFAANTVLCKADAGTGGDFGKAVPGSPGAGGSTANCVGDVKTAGSAGSTTTGGAGAAPLGG